MEEQLQAFLSRQWPDADEIAVEGFAVIAGGYSCETYRFDAHVERAGARTTYPLILRKDPPAASDILPTSRAREHDLLCLVRRHTSIPVSESYFVETDRATFGEAAMIVERMRGSGEVSALFHGGRNAGQAETIATQLCELVAQLHLTDPKFLNPAGALDDPRGEGIDASSWDSYMDTTFEYYVNGYARGEYEPVPALLDAYLTLRRKRPAPLRLSVVHGDFNPANFLYEDGQVTAIIDWENCHIGDPREDLGWLKQMDELSNTEIFGAVKTDGGFLGHYNRLTGFNVTPEEVDYFKLFATANIAIPVAASLRRRADGEHSELLHVYIFQPSVAAFLGFGMMLGYPIGGE
ncbi:MAG: phosphotransferase family protein [Tepidiformaceae bacterium]